MANLKQHIVLVEGKKTLKKASLFKKEVSVEGYITVKSANYQAKKFYTQLDLDELTDLGVTYEIKYGE